jgi:hypothetical protein
MQFDPPLDLFEAQLPPLPYPGLRPFQKSEWPIFFGREKMTDAVINLLLRQQLLLVHGPSGNGKSSLIRAGVLPLLEQQHARSDIRWRTRVSVPGQKPLTNLAKSLVDETASRPHDWVEFRRALNRGRDAAVAIAQLEKLGSNDRLCILIDQFEEIFSGSRDADADHRLLSEFLVGFSEAPPSGLFVLLTMRSEFLGLCSRFDGLAEAVNRTQYLLPRMEPENLLRAIREPALLYEGKISERLAEKLISDARKSEDELPLVQHGLSQLWKAAAGRGAPRMLDLVDYQLETSLSGLVSHHADEVMQNAVGIDSEGSRIIEELFRAITATNAEGYAIRRPRLFAELVKVTGSTEDRLRAILDVFRGPGVSFITPYPSAEIELDTLIDISHEALIRHWTRISNPQTGWLQREFRDGVIWQSLRVQAESFISDSANLLSAATTEARTSWLNGRNEAWTLRYGGMWADVQKLLEASRKEIERQRVLELERLSVAQSATHNRNYMLLAMTAALVLAGLAYKIWIEEKNAVLLAESATHERDDAKTARKQAIIERQIAISAREATEKQRLDAIAARELADEQRQTAIAALQIAEQKTKEAELAKQEAVDASQRADQASGRADYESAKSYIAAEGKKPDTLKRALERVLSEADPMRAAFFGQVVGQLTDIASAEQIRSAIENLSRRLAESPSKAEGSGLAQALVSVVNLPRIDGHL